MCIRDRDKFNYDVEYVDHITFAGDVKIILDTVGKVIHRDGISSETSATMEEFMGNEEDVYKRQPQSCPIHSRKDIRCA